QGHHNRYASDKLRNQAKLEQILRHDLAENITNFFLFFGFNFRTKAHRFLASTLLNDLLQTIKGPSADKEDVRSIDLNKLLVGMFPATLRGHAGNGAF